MAKPNYAFEKRQKELAKKQKKQEKLEQRKAGGHHDSESEDAATALETGSDLEVSAGSTSSATAD